MSFGPIIKGEDRPNGFVRVPTKRPMRVQLSRQRGWRMPPNTVKVDRSTRFGNPYQAGADGDGDPSYLAKLYRDYLARPAQADLCSDIRSALRGKNLACWCKPGAPCHADVLLELANLDA